MRAGCLGDAKTLEGITEYSVRVADPQLGNNEITASVRITE